MCIYVKEASFSTSCDASDLLRLLLRYLHLRLRPLSISWGMAPRGLTNLLMLRYLERILVAFSLF